MLAGIFMFSLITICGVMLLFQMEIVQYTSFSNVLNFDIKLNYNFSLTRTAVHLYWWNRLYRLFTHLEWYFLCASLVNKSAMHFRKSVTRWISSVGINFQQVYYAFTQRLQLSYNNQFLLNLLGESHAIETLSKRLVPHLDTISDSIHSWTYIILFWAANCSIFIGGQ